jgi:hypothetical protein
MRDIDPCDCIRKGFGYSISGTGVSFVGATSTENKMWINPVFVCNSANRLPVTVW